MQKYYILLEIVQFDEVEGESTIAAMRNVKSKGTCDGGLKEISVRPEYSYRRIW